VKEKQRKAKKERAKQHAEAQRYLKLSALESGDDMEKHGYVKTYKGGWRRLATRRPNKSIDKEK
jgi:hypothetical protein